MTEGLPTTGLIFKPENPMKPDVPPRPPVIKTWSFSRLDKFEKCPYEVFLTAVERIPQDDSPAASRGLAIHDMAERYIRNELDELPTELSKFTVQFNNLKKQHAEDPTTVVVEEDWAFDKAWLPTGWNDDDAWLRMKLDVLIRESKTSAKIIDHKSGRKFGNEFKHSQQAQLYAIGAFAKYPELTHIECNFWYLDHGQQLIKFYSRPEAAIFTKGWEKRAAKLINCRDFIPAPAKTSCKWCPYGRQNGNSRCQWSE